MHTYIHTQFSVSETNKIIEQPQLSQQHDTGTGIYKTNK